MKQFYIYPKDDEQKFYDLCKLFENTYPQFEKEELLIDPLDDELIQIYHYRDKQAIIVLERLWFYEIIYPNTRQLKKQKNLFLFGYLFLRSGLKNNSKIRSQK